MTSSTDAEPPASSPEGRVPDFFIVGHAKSGTTALYEMLRRHPEIYMPEQKEPWYFASDMKPRFEPFIAGVGPQSLAEYLALFGGAGPGQRAGEASSSYLWSMTAAEAISEVAPDARIIAILREPADFLRSLHLQLLQSHVEDQQDLRRAIGLEAERRAGRHIPRRSHRPQLLQYAGHVRYAEQLKRYSAHFPPEQMLVLIYDDFRRDNEAAIRQVLGFLDVQQDWPVEVLDVNRTVRMRSQRLDKIVHTASAGRGPLARGARAAVKAVTPRSLRREALSVAREKVVHGAPRPVDQDFALELRRRFRPEVVALSEYLDRDLVKLWGYDQL